MQSVQYVQLYHQCIISHTHTHTHPFNGPLSGTTRVSRYPRKAKPIWILLKQDCWISRLEHSAGGDSDIAVTLYFPSTAKNLALQEIISGHHYLNQNLFNFTINLEVALLLRQFLIDRLIEETVSGSGISWAICKSAPRYRQITTPAPHH